MKTVFYVKRAPLNFDVGSLTLPLKSSTIRHKSWEGTQVMEPIKRIRGKGPSRNHVAS